MKHPRCSSIVLGFATAILALSPALAGTPAWKGKTVTLLPRPNSSRWLHASVGKEHLTAELSRSRLFVLLRPEPVRLRSSDRKDNDVVFEIEGAHLGRGRITFEGGLNWSDAGWQEMLSLLFAADTLPQRKNYIGNAQSKLLHFRGCNHLPPPQSQVAFSTDREAEKQGYQKCPLCFRRVPTFSGYDFDLMAGGLCASQSSSFGPVSPDSAYQERFTSVGESTLAAWPVPLKGYHYRFYVLDSDITNAFSCPDGHIFITSGLMDVLETDRELEAVLAHEIAHTELRHVYRRYRTAKKAARWAGLAALIGGIATKRTDVAAIAAQIGTLVGNIVMRGYDRAYEEESDSFAAAFFEMNHVAAGRDAIVKALSKLQYGQEIRGISPDASGGLFATHPDLSDRIAKARSSRVGLLRDEFVGFDKSGEVVATVSFQLERLNRIRSKNSAGYELIALVESTNAMGDKTKIKNITVWHGSNKIKLDNKEDPELEPGDTVGAVFVSQKVHGLLGHLGKIKLKLPHVSEWNRRN